MIDMVESFETRWPDKSAVARSTADVESQFAAGLVSLPMGMENGAPIEEPSDSGNVVDYYVHTARDRLEDICSGTGGFQWCAAGIGSECCC